MREWIVDIQHTHFFATIHLLIQQIFFLRADKLDFQLIQHKKTSNSFSYTEKNGCSTMGQPSYMFTCNI